MIIVFFTFLSFFTSKNVLKNRSSTHFQISYFFHAIGIMFHKFYIVYTIFSRFCLKCILNFHQKVINFIPFTWKMYKIWRRKKSLYLNYFYFCPLRTTLKNICGFQVSGVRFELYHNLQIIWIEFIKAVLQTRKI